MHQQGEGPVSRRRRSEAFRERSTKGTVGGAWLLAAKLCEAVSRRFEPQANIAPVVQYDARGRQLRRPRRRYLIISSSARLDCRNETSLDQGTPAAIVPALVLLYQP